MSIRTRQLIMVNIAKIAVIFLIVMLFPRQVLWKYAVLGLAITVYHWLSSYEDGL